MNAGCDYGLPLLACVARATIGHIAHPPWRRCLCDSADGLRVALATVGSRTRCAVGRCGRGVDGIAVEQSRVRRTHRCTGLSEELATATVGGDKCVVVRLKDGRTTTIPVSVLAVDPEQFVREVTALLKQRR